MSTIGCVKIKKNWDLNRATNFAEFTFKKRIQIIKLFHE